MIVLDTNVASELMKEHDDPSVDRWLRIQSIEALFLPSFVVAEIWEGVFRLPEGRRRSLLSEAATALFAEFENRILSFDMRAARDFADIRATARGQGRQISLQDAIIAATARSRRAILATRDGGFAGLGVDLVNPWEA
ncbi:MAG: type II toxin-antitoxin system VapC family toxin [Alphaproteobacteria bacterium]|nr:type II toxin-antitoxin system VapC family toxin [Alphaproteobacteria bacterium]